MDMDKDRDRDGNWDGEEGSACTRHSNLVVPTPAREKPGRKGLGCTWGCHLSWGHHEQPKQVAQPLPSPAAPGQCKSTWKSPKLSWSPSKSSARGRTGAQPAPPAAGPCPVPTQCPSHYKHDSRRGAPEAGIPEQQRQADCFPSLKSHY